jgi:hypothetical protein
MRGRLVAVSTHKWGQLTGWVGTIVLSIGIAFWLLGFAIDLHVDEMISSLSSAGTPPKMAEMNVQWARKTYWPAPYLLWIGGTLVIVGGFLAISSYIIGNRADDKDQ